MSTHVDPIPREARPFQGHRAGLVTRTAAVAIDLGIVLIALGVCHLGVFAFLYLLNPGNFTAPTLSLGLEYAAGSLLLIVYLTVTWMGSGRTYGNHVMGLRVVNRKGQRLHLLVSLVRAVLYVIFPIGLLWVHGQWPQPLAAGSRGAYVCDLRLGRATAAAPPGADPDLSPSGLKVGHPFPGLVVAASLHLDLGRCVLDLGEFVGRQLEVGGAQVLLQPVQLARAGDRDDPRLLRE